MPRHWGGKCPFKLNQTIWVLLICPVEVRKYFPILNRVSGQAGWSYVQAATALSGHRSRPYARLWEKRLWRVFSVLNESWQRLHNRFDHVYYTYIYFMSNSILLFFSPPLLLSCMLLMTYNFRLWLWQTAAGLRSCLTADHKLQLLSFWINNTFTYLHVEYYSSMMLTALPSYSLLACYYHSKPGRWIKSGTDLWPWRTLFTMAAPYSWFSLSC